MASGGLALSAESKVESDTPIYAHNPVKRKVGGSLSKDMGRRIKRPMAFQGLTRKEAQHIYVPEGDFVHKEGNLDEQWKRWNDSFENYL
eukprot:4942085-Heterocapsa_arctica.AAC.1